MREQGTGNRGQGIGSNILVFPVTSHQSPVPSPQSPVPSHQSPVTNHQSPIYLPIPNCWAFW
ncbi:hypothetical protein H5968_22050 [Sphaerospermopsis sp. LEGE 00249]|uniref:hypothetical protein n=1 Tax=Sphaerospermopsis sp. LEGE 00249 TaxID=1380707 RepID=UPI00164D6386|nr:hypothetical protein [Sphaerospermopsis sp. LEGE 00249]MBC5797760.1 hypothetical protein [Sphaerospermopsis sp. LEGE 00249]